MTSALALVETVETEDKVAELVLTTSVICGEHRYRLGIDDEDLLLLTTQNRTDLDLLENESNGLQFYIAMRELRMPNRIVVQNLIQAENMPEALRKFEEDGGGRRWVTEDGFRPEQQQTGVARTMIGGDFMVVRISLIQKGCVILN